MQTRRDFLTMAGMAAAAASLPVMVPASGRQHPTVSPKELDISGPHSLRAHAQACGFLVGCAAVPQRFSSEPPYASAVAEQANILVAENAMKWAALRPAPDKFDFHAADELLAFVQAHGQKLRGHNLCWHESLPEWFSSTVNKENARQFLTQHIQTVAGRYAGKIHSWDVVNEAIEIGSGRADRLRKTPWLDMIGPDYLDLAYRTTRQADPSALLTYNDYGIETDAPDQASKREQVMWLIRGFKKRGVPIDAVGVQSHLSATDAPPGAGLRSFVRQLRQMNVQVFITEMDVNETNLEGSVAERDAAIAEVYKNYSGMMLAEPNVTALLTWGITDRYTWLNGAKWARPDGEPQRSLPLDADYHPAPAFFALRDAIDARAVKA
jgi:endo-1,4-beta-xylanase